MNVLTSNSFRHALAGLLTIIALTLLSGVVKADDLAVVASNDLDVTINVVGPDDDTTDQATNQIDVPDQDDADVAGNDDDQGATAEDEDDQGAIAEDEDDDQAQEVQEAQEQGQDADEQAQDASEN